LVGKVFDDHIDKFDLLRVATPAERKSLKASVAAARSSPTGERTMPGHIGVGRVKRASMKCACAWFLAKTIVLPSRSPPSILYAVLHQMRDNPVDGVLVKQALI
jgi:hypothetical protein